MVENKLFQQRRYTNDNLISNHKEKKNQLFWSSRLSVGLKTIDRTASVYKIKAKWLTHSVVVVSWSFETNLIEPQHLQCALVYSLSHVPLHCRSQSKFALVPTTGLLQDCMTKFKHDKLKNATLRTIDLYRPRFGVYNIHISNKTTTAPVLSVHMIVCCKRLEYF